MDAENDVGAAGGARESDERLDALLVAPAAILEGLPDAVVAAGRDGRIVFVNALAEELFGYPREELMGQPVQTLWPTRVRERYTRNMELYFSTGIALGDREPDLLIADADAAAYRAKAAGRGRIELSVCQ